jgi:Domain of unknown function (DUF222)
VDRQAEAREAARQHASRALHVYPDQDGTVVLRGRLAPEVGALLLQALTAARETLYQKARGAEPEADPPTMAQQQADALALLAETALHHGIDPGAPGERYQVVHVDAAVLADADAPGQSVLEDGVRVPAGTSQRLACDASRVVMRHDQGGRVLEVGARTRTIPRRYAGRCTIETTAAASPAAEWPSARAITSVTGPMEAPPRSRTSPCSAAATTAPSTRRVTASIDTRMASFASDVRTAGCCPRCRLPPRCPAIRCRACGCDTTLRAFACTHGRRCLDGWASAWTSAGPSTSCIPWRRGEGFAQAGERSAGRDAYAVFDRTTSRTSQSRICRSETSWSTDFW